MATHRTDVSVRFGIPDALEAAVGAVELPLVHVPDVRMHAEATAIAEIAAAGLVPGQRDPRPRPVSGRSEVVIRTHPRQGTSVRRGTRIDYEVAPGEPRAPMVTIPDYSDFDAASTLNAISAPPTLSPPITTTRAASDGYVDYDTADTVHVIDAGETGVLEP
jgi:beta-lactam-binding protein with PASTA domain